MKLGAMLLLVAMVGCAPSVNFGGLRPGPREANFQDHITAGRLSNGMRVAVLPDANTNLVTILVRYEVGGADDPPGAEGMAHYVEHLIFESPLRGGAVGDAALAGNAATYRDRTYFYQVALDTQLDDVLEAAARRLETTCDTLGADVLARERDVVIEEAKQRSRFSWGETLDHMVWGPGHPYARDVGGVAFASASREQLCSFIDQHYGPGAATLVVRGNIDVGVLSRIQARFGRIPARAIAPRAQLPALPADVVRTRVPGLRHATAALVFRVPGEGSDADPAIELLDGMVWRLDNGAPAWTVVVGDERARAVIAYAEVLDPANLPMAVHALQDAFAHPSVDAFAAARQRARHAFTHEMDSMTAGTARIADLAAHGAPMTRLRRLKAIDDVKAEDVARLVTGTGARIVMLEPEADVPGAHDLGEVATDLHGLEVVRPVESTDLAPPPRSAHRIDASIVEDHLPNGLTVWLAPDSSAFAIDARVVMPLDLGQGATRDLAMQAAAFLSAPAVGGTDDARTVRWYQSIGVPVKRAVGENAAVFGVEGFALFGDWHVWNLAWTLVDGSYPPALDHFAGTSPRPTSGDAPDAFALLERRLRGQTDPRSIVIASRGQLTQFRASHFDPARATLIVAGNFDVEAMRREVRTLFGRWKSSGVKPAPPAVAHAAPGFVAVPVVHSATLDIAIGFPGSAGAPAARAVLSEIMSDRLRRIRESLGISYGVDAVVDRDVILRGAIEPAYAAEAAKAMLDVIERVREGDPALVADFVRARKRVLAMALAESTGASARAHELERAAIDGHGLGELDRRIEEIRTVSIDDVRRIAARDLQPDQMIAVVRGEQAAIKAAMTAFGAAGFDTVTR